MFFRPLRQRRLSILLGLWTVAAPCSAQWTTPETVLAYPVPLVSSPSVSVSGQSVSVTYVGWRRMPLGSGPSIIAEDIYAVCREDGEWSGPTNVSNSPEPSDMVQTVNTPDGEAHVVWRDLDSEGDPVRFLYTKGRGCTFSTPEALSLPDSLQSAAIIPTPFHLVVDAGGRLHHTFELGLASQGATLVHRERVRNDWSSSHTGFKAFYSFVAPGMDSSLLSVSLGHVPPSNSGEPALRTVEFALSPDGGRTWSDRTVIATSPQSEVDQEPQIALSPAGRLHVVWRHSPSRNLLTPLLRHASSDNGGSTWTHFETIDPPQPGIIYRMNTAADSLGRFHLFYHWSPGLFSRVGRLYHTAWSGGRWSAPERLFSTDSVIFAERNPALAVDGGRVHLVWSEQDGQQGRVRYASARLVDLPGPDAGVGAGGQPMAFPNPTRDTTSLLVELAEPGEATVRVFDARGRLVLERDVGYRLAGAQSVPIVTSGLASGVYAFEVRTGAAVQTGTFTVVR